MRSAPSACSRSMPPPRRGSAASNFPTPCRCTRKELVLTFDDGPWPGTTPKVLDALKHECVRATFFLLGRNVAAHPATRAPRTGRGPQPSAITPISHPLLNRMSPARAEAEIDRGIAARRIRALRPAPQRADDAVLPLSGIRLEPRAARPPAAQRGIVVFGADVWASDWQPMTPRAGVASDPRAASTASAAASCCFTTPRRRPPQMLPAFLRELKRRGYRIVHVVPAGNRALSSRLKSGQLWHPNLLDGSWIIG